jgi:putative intracellular protease/amidase
LKTLNKARGGRFENASEPWGERVVVARGFITEQNPASATWVGRAIYNAILGELTGKDEI